MRNTLKISALAISLSLMGCEDAEKKAAEAKAMAEKAAIDAKAAAEKKAAQARAEAEKQAAEIAAKAKEAVAGPKAELMKKFDEGLAAMDRKVDFLKGKAAKLPAKVKAKAEAALAAYDSAKATLVGMKAQIEGIGDPAALTDVGSKVTEAMDAAQKALTDAEAAITKK
jgi:colicin import membrane protein